MNAIILAAGMGTRLRPLTNDIPKCLVPVLGVPMIEQQIKFLHKAGIRDIILVSGYKAERLDYLIHKYGVKIVANERFDTCNNIYSLYKVRECFGDSFIIEGDVYMSENPFVTIPSVSSYLAAWRDDYTREWGLMVDEANKLLAITPGNGSGYIMSGVSYWTVNDAQHITTHLERIMAEEDYTELFWDDILLRHSQELDIRVQPCNVLHEIDTVDELHALEALLTNRNI